MSLLPKLTLTKRKKKMLDLYTQDTYAVTKDMIGAMQQSIIDAIEGGNVDPLEMHIKAKAVKKVVDEVIKKTDDIVREEASKYGAKRFERFSAVIQMKEASESPDYAEDPIWQQLNAKLKAREEQLKQAFQMRGKGVLIDEDTGEQVLVVPPKFTKGNITISFK